MVAGSISFSTEFDNELLEKELVQLKKNFLKLEGDLQFKKLKKNDLEEQLNAANEALKKIHENTEIINGRAVFGPGDLERILQLKDQIPQLEKEIRKCDGAIHDSDLKLESTRQRYDEILERARSLRAVEEPVGHEQSQPDPHLQELADKAAQAAERMSQLKQEIAELQEKNNRLGWAIGAKSERADLEAKIVGLSDSLQECRTYLDALAENGDLGQISGGAEIARQRIDELNSLLMELEDRQARMGMAWGPGGKEEYDQLSAEIENANRLLEAYRQNLGEVPTEGLHDVAESAQIANQHIADLNKELSELKDRQKELSKDGIGLGYEEYDRNAVRIAEITEELKEYQKQLAQAGGGGRKTIGQTSAVAEQLHSVLQKIAAIGGKASRQAVSMFSNIGKAAVSSMKSSAKAVAAASKKILSFAKNMNVLTRLSDAVGKKLKRFGQMLRRVFVFSVITSGLRAVRTEMAAYLKLNTQFTEATRRLQGVLLTAFQPIYQTVVPALTAFINTLSRAIATVSQFFASLFGTTAKQAQQNAKDLYEQAHATEAAGDAAEEASNQLASFDEINKLGDENASSGGSAEAETGPLFDWEYEDTPFDSWGEAFSAFLDKLLGGIPKLEDALAGFADGLNDWSEKVLDMFTFPGVLDKVKQLGRDLAEAFNGLVDLIDWDTLGRALGAGLNTALNFLTSLLYGFDWLNLGRKLAEFVNGLVQEVDWYEFGRLLWAGFKIGLETLAGFILGLNMPELAQAASNIVMGFFDSMKETIDGIPWDDIGKQIASFLNNIEWVSMLSSIAAAIASGLNAAIHTLGALVADLEWGTIGTAIGLALNRLFLDIDWAAAGKAFSDALNGMLELAIGFLEATDWEAIGRDIVTFFENIDWLTLFLNLATVIGDAVWAVIQLAIGLVEDHLPEILLAIYAIVTAIALGIPFIISGLGPVIIGAIVALVALVIAKWDEITAYFLEKIEECGGNVVLGLLKGIADAVVGIGTWLWEHLVKPIIDAVKNLFGIHSPSTVFAEIGGFLIYGLLQGISNAWHTILDFFSEKIEALKKSLSDAWEAIKTTASEKWESIKTTLGTLWDSIKTTADTTWENLKTTIGTAWETIQTTTSEVWDKIWTTLGGVWENVKTTAGEKFEAVRTKVSEAWTNIKTDIPARWDAIQTALSGAWESVKTAAGQKFTSIKDAIIDKMGELKDHDWLSIGSSIMNGIWDGLQKVWDKVSGWAKDAADWLGNAFSSVKSTVSSAGSAIANSGSSASRAAAYSMPDISGYSIPALARGAVIPPNREFLAVLGDQKSGNNFEAPESLLRQVVREESGGNVTQLLQEILSAVKEGKIIMVDRKVLGSVVTQEQNRVARANGRSAVLT